MRPTIAKLVILSGLICALIWNCALVTESAAIAETGAVRNALSIEVSANPAEMVAPGDVMMTFIIANHSAADLRNVYLSSADGLLSEPIGQIGAGETQTLFRSHTVTQAELEAGEVRYTLSHDGPLPSSDKVVHTFYAPVKKSDARPAIDFTRQASSTSVVLGGQVTMTYRLTNRGNVPVTDILVQDALGDFIGRLDQLAVGASKTFISRVTVTAQTQSEASLTYSVPSGEKYLRKLDSLPIRLSESVLDVSFSVGRSAFDPDRADAILTLTCLGDDSYGDITVLDDIYGGVIADAITLPGDGTPVEIAYTYPVRGSGEYRWRVTGTSKTGRTLDYVTDTKVLPDETVARLVAVRVAASARTPLINRPGPVTFDIELTNHGTVMAQDIQLYELHHGEVRKLAVVPTGEPTRCHVSYWVESNEAFTFCVNYTDAYGYPRIVSAPTIDIVIAATGVTPEAAPSETAELEGASVKLVKSSGFTVLLVVAFALVVSMFTILLVTSLRARRDRRRRNAEQRKRDAMANSSKKNKSRSAADKGR